MDLVQSELLRSAGFLHGFTTRDGGVSDGPYRSLNLGRGVGDDEQNVESNRARVAKEFQIPRFWTVNQVHSRDVLVLAPGDDEARVALTAADAIVAKDAQAVAVRVADCLPLLLADPSSGSVAAVHCGWRGVASGIVEVVASQLPGHPRGWLAAIGPHIRPENFEIGVEVAQKLRRAASADTVSERKGTWRGHLSNGVRAQLRQLGVRDDRIEDVGGDSYDMRFFSYRRDHGVTGRQIGLIVGRERS